MKFGPFQELFSLKKYFYQFRLSYALGFCSLLLSTVFTMLIPRILKQAIDSIKTGTSSGFLLRCVVLIVLFALIQGCFKFLMRNIVIGISRKIEYQLRNDFFAHVQTLSISFFQRHRTGDIMSRATNDLNAVRSFLGPGIMYFTYTLILFLMDLIFMLSLNIKLTIIVLIPFPLVSFLIMNLAKRLHTRFKAVQEQFAAINTQIQENFSGIRITKAYVREQQMADRFLKANELYLQKNMELVKIWGLFHPITSILSGFFLLLIVWIGGAQVISGNISLGGLAAFISYVGILVWPAMALGWVINLIQRGAVSMGRINEIMRTEPEIKDSPKAKPLHKFQAEIEMKNVSFGPLRNIGIKIHQGESIGLVGRTGAGKSCLVNLIARLYDATAGEIKISGTAIHNIPLQQLRAHIGYVPQETFIFSDSIKQNIGFGLPEDSFERIKEAAFFSHLLDDIEEFPEKFETVVGERGITLSGGQKQRVAISRALVRKSPILIFDDVFSSLDLNTEHKILEKLNRIMKDRTYIIISHRISAVRNCDRIYVLEDGKIVEHGNHQILIARDGPYARIYEKQLLIQELEKEE
ncbi:MAG: ABC transporter ATP-binding protein [bacterium]